MAGRFSNPFPQFFNSTPTALLGARLFFYEAGTSTKLNTYSDRALASPNTNPVILNSAGRPDVEIWLQDRDYKVVLAPSTDSDPPSSPIWSSDYVRGRDSALIAKTVTGSGSPNGAVAGTAGSSSILPDFYWDYTGAILYVCTTTGTSGTAVWTAINAASASAVVVPPQGYLTPTSATPVIPGDVSAATAVYYTLDKGNLVPIYNGSSFVPTTVTELTLALSSSHVASNIYDVFIFNNSGVPTIVTGPSWSAGSGGSIAAGSCARGTGAGGAALARVNGIFTNSVSITGRNGATTYTIGANLATYVGSLFMDGTNGQISCHRSYGSSRKWGVWNAYNRKPITLKAGDSTASWSYASTTVRAARAQTTNSLTIFSGLAEDEYRMDARANVLMGSSANATVIATNGIGYNSTTAASGYRSANNLQVDTAVGYNISYGMHARYTAPPALGINVITALESGSSITLLTFNGGEANHLLEAAWQA